MTNLIDSPHFRCFWNVAIEPHLYFQYGDAEYHQHNNFDLLAYKIHLNTNN